MGVAADLNTTRQAENQSKLAQKKTQKNKLKVELASLLIAQLVNCCFVGAVDLWKSVSISANAVAHASHVLSGIICGAFKDVETTGNWQHGRGMCLFILIKRR